MQPQVPAVLPSITRVWIPESAAFLFLQVQTENETGAVNPALATWTQSPFCFRWPPGVCHLRPARAVATREETISRFLKREARLARRTGHLLMAMEKDLRPKRRMPTPVEGAVSPRRIPAVERVGMDERQGMLTSEIAELAGLGPLHFPHRCPRFAYQNQEQPRGAIGTGHLILFHRINDMIAAQSGGELCRSTILE